MREFVTELGRDKCVRMASEMPSPHVTLTARCKQCGRRGEHCNPTMAAKKRREHFNSISKHDYSSSRGGAGVVQGSWLLLLPTDSTDSFKPH